MTEDIFSYIHGPYGRLASLRINFHDRNPARIIFAHGYSASASMVEHAKLFQITALQAAQQLDAGSVLFDFSGNGMSDGRFQDMSPNRRIDELVNIIDTVSNGYNGKIFLVGFSMGGAISVFAASRRSGLLAGLATWSCVPSFDHDASSAQWYPKMPDANHSESPGAIFYSDRPDLSMADAYISLTMPKLQIQGDGDYPFFAEEFKAFFERAPEPKKYILLKGGDHIFARNDVRQNVIDETISWLRPLCLPVT